MTKLYLRMYVRKCVLDRIVTFADLSKALGFFKIPLKTRKCGCDITKCMIGKSKSELITVYDRLKITTVSFNNNTQQPAFKLYDSLRMRIFEPTEVA